MVLSTEHLNILTIHEDPSSGHTGDFKYCCLHIFGQQAQEGSKFAS
jgi:hypothetical protein